MISYKYCTQCKSELDLSNIYPKCLNCDITYYKNSKPTVGILPVKSGKVLLVKRAIEPYMGELDIIGGFLEDGEHPEEGIVREALEETGLKVIPKEILGIYIDKYGDNDVNTLNIHYIGEITGGTESSGHDAESLHWLDIDTLNVNEGFQNTRSALSDLKLWYSKKKGEL